MLRKLHEVSKRNNTAKLTHIKSQRTQGEREIVLNEFDNTEKIERGKKTDESLIKYRKKLVFFGEEEPTKRAKFCGEQNVAGRESSDEVKRRRAYDECLGIRSRRRT